MPRQLQINFIEALLALIFAGATSAHAAPSLSCKPPGSLRGEVKSCDGNSAYSDAARLCVDRYEAAVSAARTEMAQALAKVSSSDKQAQGLDNTKAAYETSIASLKMLVALGGKLRSQILAYKNEVVLPEDFGAIGASGFSPKVFLNGNPCYKSTQDLLSLYTELMDSRAKELELTQKIAEVLSSKAFRGELGLKPEDILPMLTTPAGVGTPGRKGTAPENGGKSKSGKSDITGTGNTKDKSLK